MHAKPAPSAPFGCLLEGPSEVAPEPSAGAPRSTLDRLLPGERGRTVSVGTGPAASPSDDSRETPGVAQRLLELGFVPGTVVRVVRYAPFGDPIEVELRGYHLSLRKAEAALIEVERLEPFPGVCARG